MVNLCSFDKKRQECGAMSVIVNTWFDASTWFDWFCESQK